MNIELIPEFKRLYLVYRKTDAYAERVRQFRIAAVNRDIARETLTNVPLTNEHLTGLIQLFKNGSTDATYDRYLAANIADPERRAEISVRAYDIGEDGYTGAGLHSIGGLSQEHLEAVRSLLEGAFTATTIAGAESLCADFDAARVPLVTSGIYSPWLYYINPELFPIINRSHIPFRRWMDIPADYPSCIRDFNALKEVAGESELGNIDRFTHDFEKYIDAPPERAVLNLDNHRFFKMSHGIFAKKKKYRANGILKILEEENIICLSQYTGRGAGKKFIGYARPGDFVYICYGGDDMYCIARITSESLPLDKAIDDLIDGNGEWVYRRIEPLYFPEVSSVREFKKNKHGFMPSANNTFSEVPNNQLGYLNKNIFIPNWNLEIINEPIPAQPILNIDQKEKMETLYPNTILYGPPGTGKTYELLKIIEQYKLVEKLAKPKPDYDTFVQAYTWWQILVFVFWDIKKATVPELLKNEIIKAKMRTTSVGNPRARLWSVLQQHTVEHCEDVKFKGRSGEPLFFKEKDSVWRLDDAKVVKDDFPALKEAWDDINGKDFQTSEIKHYTFTTCHQNLAYEDFIEGIKPVLFNATVEDSIADSVQYIMKRGVFYEACEKAAQLAGYDNLSQCLHASKKDREVKFKAANDTGRRYVLFMDEINRCNISAVFGELITLIEEDKRLGAENEIADVTLPYSQTLFGVPGNLYLVGTMNTADRSVEALDTALRRRFVFEQKNPLPDKLKMTTDGIDLPAMLRVINRRLELLLDKDHAIGHAWLWNVSSVEGLKTIFQHKILPLLQEYFYNNLEKIGLVLGDAFVVQEQVDPKAFAKFKNGAAGGDYLEEGLYAMRAADQLGVADFQSIYLP